MAFDPRDVSAFVAFVRGEAQGVVATVSPSGAPEAALVGIVFDTLVGSRKAENLRHDHRIAVVIGTDGSVSAQIDGFGTIVHGTLREEYGGAYNAQFPGSRSLDPGFAVVVVRPAWVRVYDASESPAVVTEARW